MKIAIQPHASGPGRLVGLCFRADTFQEELQLQLLVASLLTPGKCIILDAERITHADGTVTGDGTNGKSYFLERTEFNGD